MTGSQISVIQYQARRVEIARGREMKMKDNEKPQMTNLLDPHSVKRVLDRSVSENLKNRGYIEDMMMRNLKLLIGTILIIITLFAQFYKRKFPDNGNFLIGCIALYVIFSGVLQLILCLKEKDAILFAYAPSMGSLNTRLAIYSKLPSFSELYTLTVSSSDPQSKSDNKPVTFTKSVTHWFTEDGMLMEGLFWKDVDDLMEDYSKESTKHK